MRYEAVTDAEALEAFELLTRTEGIIPAIESAHALALLPRLAAELGPDATVVVNAVRPRRQGHRHRAGGAGCERAWSTRVSSRARSARTPALVAYLMAATRTRDARSRRCAPPPRRAPTSSSSACRTRDPLADGPVIAARRARGPGVPTAASASPRRSTLAAEFLARRGASAARRAHDLPEPDDAPRSARDRRRRARRRASAGSSCPTCRRTWRTQWLMRRRPRVSTPSSSPLPPPLPSGSRTVAACLARLRLLRVDHGVTASAPSCPPSSAELVARVQGGDGAARGGRLRRLDARAGGGGRARRRRRRRRLRES